MKKDMFLGITLVAILIGTFWFREKIVSEEN